MGGNSMFIVDVIFPAMAVSKRVDYSTKKGVYLEGQVNVHHVLDDQLYSTALQ